MADIETPTWRNKHKIGSMMTRLQKHGEGEIKMTATQIAAAKLFLSKTLPDLASIQMSGDPNGEPIKTVTRIERVVVDPKTSE